MSLERRRFRRVGVASLALSASAILAFGSALPAAAAPQDGKKECKKGVDPQSTMDNIVCQWNNNVDDIKNKIDEATKPEEKAKPEQKPAEKTKAAKKTTKKKAAPAYKAPRSTVRFPTTRSMPLAVPDNFRKLPKSPTTSVLPQQPQVAGPADAPPEESQTQSQTRLVAPVAATAPVRGPDQATTLWAAAGAAAATGAVMLQFSVFGARMRRRAREGR